MQVCSLWEESSREPALWRWLPLSQWEKVTARRTGGRGEVIAEEGVKRVCWKGNKIGVPFRHRRRKGD